MSTVLVTGASGLVGSRLLPRLIADGHDCRALVRGDRTVPAGVSAVRGDLDDSSGLAAAVRGVDAVVHLAALFRSGDDAAIWRANLDGTRHLLAAGRPTWTVLRLPFVYGDGDGHLASMPALAARFGLHPAHTYSVAHHRERSMGHHVELLGAATDGSVEWGGSRHEGAHPRRPQHRAELRRLVGARAPSRPHGSGPAGRGPVPTVLGRRTIASERSLLGSSREPGRCTADRAVRARMRVLESGPALRRPVAGSL